MKRLKLIGAGDILIKDPEPYSGNQPFPPTMDEKVIGGYRHPDGFNVLVTEYDNGIHGLYRVDGEAGYMRGYTHNTFQERWDEALGEEVFRYRNRKFRKLADSEWKQIAGQVKFTSPIDPMIFE